MKRGGRGVSIVINCYRSVTKEFSAPSSDAASSAVNTKPAQLTN